MNLKKDCIFCFFTLLIVFIFFYHTMFYPWRHFDEQIIYNETLLPSPAIFLQLKEYILNFGLINYIEASNPFYTTISNMRCAPGGSLFFLFIFYLFQKSAFAFHTFSLCLHLLNTCLCFLVINRSGQIIFNSFNVLNLSNTIRLFLVTITSLLWALHPVNIETVLLSTNCGALLTYFFCFLFFYYFTNTVQISRINSSINLSHAPFLFFIYFIPLLLNEYSITLPLILFVYLSAISIFYSPSSNLKSSTMYNLNRILPMLLTLILFSVNFLLLPRINVLQEKSLTLTIERVFWLSPQIFFHFLKLIFLPIHLTIDQSSLVQISNSIFEPYSVFCFLLMFGLILFSIFAALNLKKKTCFYFFILFLPFFISLVPFLHIISPLYNLASERYLYFPSFILILGISHIIFFILITVTTQTKKILICSLIFLSTFCLSLRAYSRTLDWKDSVSLFKSTLKESRSDLIKGLRMEMLGGVLFSYSPDSNSKKLGMQFIKDGISLLETSLLQLQFKKLQYQNKVPQIIKLYGLDPKTIQAKTAYLLGFTKLGLERNPQDIYNLMKSHMEDLSIIDTQILDLYTGLLFYLGKMDEAEKLLNYALEKKASPTIFLPLAEIYKNKYKDWSKAEILLKESFKYFPYDSRTLLSLKDFYLQTQNPSEYAYYSYLHGLRTHAKQSLEEALKVYQSLYNQKMTDKIKIQLNYAQNKK